MLASSQVQQKTCVRIQPVPAKLRDSCSNGRQNGHSGKPGRAVLRAAARFYGCGDDGGVGKGAVRANVPRLYGDGISLSNRRNRDVSGIPGMAGGD